MMISKSFFWLFMFEGFDFFYGVILLLCLAALMLGALYDWMILIVFLLAMSAMYAYFFFRGNDLSLIIVGDIYSFC